MIQSVLQHNEAIWRNLYDFATRDTPGCTVELSPYDRGMMKVGTWIGGRGNVTRTIQIKNLDKFVKLIDETNKSLEAMR